MVWLTWLFWVALGLIAYSYFVFPVLLILRGLLWPKPFRTEETAPRVSVLIAAYNEAGSIAERIANLNELDYPKSQIEIIIASDGSSDATNDIVRNHPAPNVRLIELPRQGKGPTINAAAREATGEVLVFTDANTNFAPDALRELVKPLSDECVGGVAGNQVYLRDDRPSSTADGERAYWGYDRMLKRMQSRAGSVTSATGAIYCIRKSLFDEVPNDAMDDFVVSTGVIAHGFRLVFAPRAVAHEPVAVDANVEYSRKVRVMTQGLRAVQFRRSLLNPIHHGFYSVQVFSHKVLRRLVVFPLIVLLVITPVLWNAGWLYRSAAIAQAIFYGGALLGVLLRRTRAGGLKLLVIPSYFCMVNIAALVAVMNLARGRQIGRWEPERHAVAARHSVTSKSSTAVSS